MNCSEKHYESPFIWINDPKLVSNDIDTEEPAIDVDGHPEVLIFIKSIMITFFRTKREDFDGALRNMEETSEMWETYRQCFTSDNTVSSKALYHIMKATEYYFYKSSNDAAKCQQIYNELVEESSALEGQIERATIDGCKSAAWTSFHERGWKEAIPYARKAVSKSPNCALWHYFLANNLRYSRRLDNDYELTDEEKKEWEKSYELSKMPFYGIHLAEMYRSEMYSGEIYENRENREKARGLYSEISAMKPLNLNTNLRLARGFMALSDLTKAKDRLDFAEEKGADGSSMFWHYKGIYYEKQKKYQKAAACLERAMKDKKNFRADLQYANVKFKLDRQFDRIEYFESMLVKYDDDAQYKQQLLLHIAMHYWEKINMNVGSDQQNALSYFLEAIEVDPTSNILTKFMNSTLDWKSYNIYVIIKTYLPNYYRKNPSPPENERQICQRLKALCIQHSREKIADSIAGCLAKVKVS